MVQNPLDGHGNVVGQTLLYLLTTNQEQLFGRQDFALLHLQIPAHLALDKYYLYQISPEDLLYNNQMVTHLFLLFAHHNLPLFLPY